MTTGVEYVHEGRGTTWGVGDPTITKGVSTGPRHSERRSEVGGSVEGPEGRHRCRGLKWVTITTMHSGTTETHREGWEKVSYC